MPLDPEERDKIREAYAGQPGTGHLVEQAATAYQQAADLGDETQMEANERRLGFLGADQTGAQREQAKAAAAAKRREAAEARKDDDAKADAPPPKSARKPSTRGGEQG